MSTPILLLCYLVLAVFVVYFSIKLSFYVDELDKKTNLSGAFIGGIMLAAVTSLPELFTSITSVVIGSPELVLGNVLGSDNFNLIIIGICLLFAAAQFTRSKISKTHLFTLLLTLLMFGAAFFGVTHQNSTINLVIFSIDVASVAILIIYIINVKLIAGDDEGGSEDPAATDMSPRQILVRFVFFAVLLVVVSIILTQVTDQIAERLQLGKTVAGAVFLGVATSLPELTSSINLVRLNNFNASIGNVTGSNIFNFIILVFGDFLLTKGSIYINDGASTVMILFGVVSTVLAILVMFSKKNVWVLRLLGLLLIVSYVCSIGFSM